MSETLRNHAIFEDQDNAKMITNIIRNILKPVEIFLLSKPSSDNNDAIDAINAINAIKNAKNAIK